jgi:outer membrane protein
MNKTLTGLAVAGMALASVSAQAWEQGDMLLRGGLATVAPDASSDGVAIPALDVGPIAGTSVDVDDNSQLGITFTYMYSESFGVEVLASTPFKHEIEADLRAADFGVVPVGETKHLPPTVSAVWYPFGSSSEVKPYVGAGINYTTFFSESVDPALEAGVPDIARALTDGAVDLGDSVPLDLELDDSFGVALQAGFDWVMDSKWHLNASVRWIDIGTDAVISNRDLGTIITVDNVDIDPWVYQINIGYKF